jgi:hypothetical protein
MKMVVRNVRAELTEEGRVDVHEGRALSALKVSKT